MTITYCLITSGADFHSTSTQISALSVRRLHPAARIVVLTDAASAQNLQACRHGLLDVVNEFIVLDVPDGPAALRHRFIKLQQRERVPGDFLYLDGDTLVIAPIDEIFGGTSSLAAVANYNTPSGAMEPCVADELGIFRVHRWAILPLPYVNGGVLFFRDTPEAHALNELWSRKWHEASSGGRHNDQEALNSALWDGGFRYDLLPHRFNAQIHARPRSSLGASILHIYATTPPELAPKTHWNALIQRGLAGDDIAAREVHKLCQERHPWVISGPIDAWLVWSILHRRDFLPIGAFERTWLAGRPRRACRNWVKSLFARSPS